ncbi:MAG: protein kinase, partial [Candidatus Eremiobacterota bacterium]
SWDLVKWSDPMETILVVDDSLENREVLARRLTRKGFRVLEADGGPAALSVLASEAVDLILLDLMMPGMSGIDVLKAVRPKHPATELPILMVSAHHDSLDVVEALKSGANDYITKPVDFPVALARIKSQLARRASQVATAPFVPEPGAVVGSYRLESRLGQGGMGVVFRAMDERLRRSVAVKVITTQDRLTPEDVKRFVQEARSLARVRHPHVVQVYDVGSSPCPFLVMELVPGRNLDDYLRERRPSYAEVARLGAQVARALQAVHEAGVVHRDVKPANVMVDQAGSARLMDFGLARNEAVELRITEPGYILGTPTHLAPEVLDPDRGPTDSLSDLWALGVVLYEMLTGELPFPSQSLPVLLGSILTSEPPLPRDLRPDVPPPLQAICLRALQKKRTARWTRAADMAAALEEVRL